MDASRREGLRHLLLALAAALPAAAAAAARAARAQEGAGGNGPDWFPRPFRGDAPVPRFRASGGAVAVEGAPGAAGMVVRRVSGPPGCLAWRWRVDAGPPPTDLTARPGDDRALCVWVGFDGWPPGATLAQRAAFAVAESRDRSGLPLPRSALGYAFGGLGAPRGFFPSPSLRGLGMVRVLRPASLPQGRWFEEHVDLAADWRAAFRAGEGDPAPPLLELAVSSDGDATGSAVDARVGDLRLGSPGGACR